MFSLNAGFKEKTMEKILFISALLIIAAVSLRNVGELNSIFIIGDEYGYWASAAYFNGKNWGDVTSLNPYYAYGYSVLLAVILILVPNSVMAYKAAVILNAVFICGSFIFLLRTTHLLFNDVSKKIQILVCCGVSLYSNTVFQAQTTQVEIFLYFLFCLISYIFIKYLQSKKIRYGIAVCFLSVYLFTSHMRCISIVISITLSLTYLLIKKLCSKTHVFIMLLVLFFGLAISLYGKKIIQDNIYNIENLEIDNTYKDSNNANDFSGQADKIQKFLSLQGIIQFLLSYIGKVYYLCSASFLIFSWCIWYLIRALFLKDKENSIKYIFSIFLFLSIFLSVSVSAMFFIVAYRQDNLVYGRYNEHILGPVLAIGMLYFFQNLYKYKKHLFIVFSYILMALPVIYTLSVLQVDQLYDNNVVGISYWILKIFGRLGRDNFGSAVTVLVVVLYLFLSFIPMVVNKKDCACFILVVVCSVSWIHFAENVFLNNTKRQQKNIASDYDLYQQTDDGEYIYFVLSDAAYNYIDYLQFFHMSNSIQIIDEDVIFSLDKGSYIFGYSKEPFKEMTDMLNCVGESIHFVLFQKKI